MVYDIDEHDDCDEKILKDLRRGRKLDKSSHHVPRSRVAAEAWLVAYRMNIHLQIDAHHRTVDLWLTFSLHLCIQSRDLYKEPGSVFLARLRFID